MKKLSIKKDKQLNKNAFLPDSLTTKYGLDVPYQGSNPPQRWMSNWENIKISQVLYVFLCYCILFHELIKQDLLKVNLVVLGDKYKV